MESLFSLQSSIVSAGAGVSSKGRTLHFAACVHTCLPLLSALLGYEGREWHR